MPTLVHIADEKNIRGIKRSGIAPGKRRGVVFFMPVVRDHFISHQWLRELKRGGARVLVGVYFRMPSHEIVWAGKYNAPHQRVPLGLAIRELGALADPLGYELFVDRRIGPGEITKVRHLPQNIGWRYHPNAHGTRPCGCPACLPKGGIKSRKIRESYDPQPAPPSYEALKARIAEETDIDALLDCLWPLRNKRRAADPAFLERLMSIDNAELQEELARTLAHFRHKHTKRLLLALCAHQAAEVREAATESLVELYRQDSLKLLGPLAADPTVRAVLDEKLL